MRQIKLDFQQSNYSLWRWVGISLLTTGLILVVLLALKNQQMSAQTHVLLTEIDHIRHPAKVVTTSENETQNEAIKNQLIEADTVIKRLNMPWPELFKALEDTREPDIHLLAVTPDAQTGDVRIIGQAESLQAAFEYMTRLKKSQAFSKIELNDHQKLTQGGAQMLRFTISAQWLADHE